jgi:hypothetical protein
MLDLGLGSTKNELIDNVDDGPCVNCRRDDKTQVYMLQFFRNVVAKLGVVMYVSSRYICGVGAIYGCQALTLGFAEPFRN